ncbi:gamma-glutamyltransferase family protein [Mycolicibacterium monacense]|nr:gamma-glutamyltransferase family protein [Mycolicibacterium monacense]
MSSAAGMVATSHPMAVRTAVTILEEGGTAADAAVAAAAMLTVVDPPSTGVGGDLFALYWESGGTEPVGLAAAGVAPAALSVQALRDSGFDTMPADGPWTVTVPGATWGWSALLERYGTLGRDRVVAPAVEAARTGFAVTPAVAEEWKLGANRLRADPHAAALFLPAGRAPRVGDVFRNPDLAETLQTYAREGHAPFYTGDIAADFADAVHPLRTSDLGEWAGPEWVTPIRARFRGVDVYEMPPPGQGLAVLQALRLYQRFAPYSDHHLVESIKAAVADAADHIADPRFHPVPVAELLGDGRVGELADRIGATASDGRTPGTPSDTVYVCVVDRWGAACSLIQSIYDGFGSGVLVPGRGVLLHNRGAGFTLRDGHPNRPEPRKRPYHTIIPAMLGGPDGFRGCLGVVGGFMQPQGQVQVLRNVLDRGMSAQQAVDAPRLRVLGGHTLGLEEGFDASGAAELARRGHRLSALPRSECGGAQLILRTPAGLDGGSDFRRDGYVGVC